MSKLVIPGVIAQSGNGGGGGGSDSIIKDYEALSYTVNTTLFTSPLPIPNLDVLTEAGTYRVHFDMDIEGTTTTVTYIADVSPIKVSDTLFGYMQNLYIGPGAGDSVSIFRSGMFDGSSITWADWSGNSIAEKQNKTLSSAITVGGVSQTTVEGALGAINTNTDGALKNTATGTDSLTILGTKSNSISAINIGKGSEASASYTTALGNSSVARGQNSTVLGLGANDHYNRKCTLIGSYAHADDGAPYGVAIGSLTRVTASGAIQLGNNTDSYIINSTANSFQVFNYQMLDGTTGKIPAERLPGTYVQAVLQNFELHDRTSSGPAIPSNPKIGQEQCVYDFTDNTSVKIDNILAQASSLTSFDIVTSCMQTSSPGSATDGIITILQQDSTNNATLRLTKDDNGLLRLRVSSDVTSEIKDIDITSNSAVVVSSQKVWLKVSYSSTTGYKVYSSSDGSTWTEVMSSSSTAPLDNICDNIQFGRNGTSYFKGIFYMRDTYININGQTVFKAVNIGKIPMIWD